MGKWNNQQGGYGNRNGGGGKSDTKPIVYPEEFKEFELTDSSGNITDNLFDIIAENISKSFVTNVANEKDRKGVSGRQIRKIFDEAKSYDISLITNTKNWTEVKPYVQMIRSKVAYAVARAKDKAARDVVVKKAYDNFMNFMTCGLQQVDSIQKYHIFMNLFEAVYGFYYQRKPSDK